jgi:hypothetical protein
MSDKELVKLGEGEVTKDQLRNHAGNTYKKMQISWFEFARCIFGIHNSDAYLEYGYENFKEFCINEYKDLDYNIILKFVHIYKEFGKNIEDKLKKKADQILPSYNSFYELVTAKKKLPPPALTKMKKDLFDQKTSYRALRADIKEQTSSILESEEDKVKAQEKMVQGEEASLAQTLKDKNPKIMETKATKTEASSFLDEMEGDNYAEKIANGLKPLKALMEKIITDGKMNDDITECGNTIEEFMGDIDKFLNGLEKL